MMYRQERKLSDERIDIWRVIFEQTPAVLRWVMGILTLGIFSLASVVYRWHRDDMEKMASQMYRMSERMDRMESRLEQQLQHINDTLLVIASNTK